ncbi:hypothetical protein Amuc02_10950 [Akkermansia muciniphila]|nr:hypothetical protein Amuc02_10950 [Akkermansia muciniphila]
MAFVFASFFLDINLKKECPGNIGKKPSFDKPGAPNGLYEKVEWKTGLSLKER